MNREPGRESGPLIQRIRIVLDRMRVRLVGRPTKENQHQPSFDPQELLILFASAGPEGQHPKVSFEEGSTLIFEPKSKFFAPQTIFREEYVDDTIDKHIYMFWCVGDYQPDGSVPIYNASYASMDYTSPYLELGPGFFIYPRFLTKNTKQGIEFVVGNEGILVDLWFLLRNDNQGIPPPGNVIDLRKQRRTVKIDVMQMGTPVKIKIKEPKLVQKSQQLNPSPVPAS